MGDFIAAFLAFLAIPLTLRDFQSAKAMLLGIQSFSKLLWTWAAIVLANLLDTAAFTWARPIGFVLLGSCLARDALHRVPDSGWKARLAKRVEPRLRQTDSSWRAQVCDGKKDKRRWRLVSLCSRRSFSCP